MAQIFAGQRQIQTHRLAVFGYYRVPQEGNPQGLVANCSGLFSRLGRLGHEPFEFYYSQSPRLYIINCGQPNHIGRYHSDLLVWIFRVIPAQRFGKFCQFVNSPQRIDVKYPVGMALIDNAHYDHVIESQLASHLVVVHPHWLVGRQHVFRIGIYL